MCVCLYSLQVFHQHGLHEVFGVRGDASKVLVGEAEVIAHNVGTRLLLTLVQERGHAAQQNVHHNTQTPASTRRMTMKESGPPKLQQMPPARANTQQLNEHGQCVCE